jgi:hypothetical protein
MNAFQWMAPDNHNGGLKPMCFLSGENGLLLYSKPRNHESESMSIYIQFSPSWYGYRKSAFHMAAAYNPIHNIQSTATETHFVSNNYYYCMRAFEGSVESSK